MTETTFSRVTDYNRMGDLFHFTLEYDLLDRTFYGQVNMVVDFINLMKGAHLYVAMQEGEVVGYSWLNMFTGRAAAFHICLFPTAQDKQSIGREFLKYILHYQDESGYYVDCLIGLVPNNYQHVRNFVERIGMRSAGYIPHAVEPGRGAINLLIYTVTREDIKEK